MEQIKKATQHVPASKMNKEVYEPASAVDVSYFMTFLVAFLAFCPKLLGDGGDV